MDFMYGHRREDRLNRWHASSLVFGTAVSDKCNHKSMAPVLSGHAFCELVHPGNCLMLKKQQG